MKKKLKCRKKSCFIMQVEIINLYTLAALMPFSARINVTVQLQWYSIGQMRAEIKSMNFHSNASNTMHKSLDLWIYIYKSQNL